MDDEARMQREKKIRRSITILLSVVAAFVLCVLPFNTIMLYLSHYIVNGKVRNIDFDTFLILNLVMNVSYPLHACVNPVIYTVIDQDFRKTLVSMVSSRRRKEKQSVCSITTVV